MGKKKQWKSFLQKANSPLLVLSFSVILAVGVALLLRSWGLVSFEFQPTKAAIAAGILVPTALEAFKRLMFARSAMAFLREIEDKEHAALSLVFLRFRQKSEENALTLLGVASVLSLILCIGGFVEVPVVVVVMLVTCSFIARQMLLIYRVKKGYFGTNCAEAKEYLEFLISHSDDIDFTDGNGGIKQALLPEATKLKYREFTTSNGANAC